MTKVGYAVGTCSRCGKQISRLRPADVAVCDCSEYCPRDHGNGPFGTKMESYAPDLTPNIYGPIKAESRSTWGGTEHPMSIFRRCPVCGYLSAQLPVEVYLS